MRRRGTSHREEDYREEACLCGWKGAVCGLPIVDLISIFNPQSAIANSGGLGRALFCGGTDRRSGNCRAWLDPHGLFRNDHREKRVQLLNPILDIGGEGEY